MELLYITDVSQIKFILENASDLLNRFTPITGDLVVSNELESLGVNFIDEWDYLSPNDIESNWRLSAKLTKCWWEELGIDQIYFENISLSQCASQDLTYSFEAALNARTAYEKIIEAHNVTRIVGFFLENRAVIRTGPYPTHRAVRSISQAVLFWIAKSKNIQVDSMESTYNLSSGIIKRKSVFLEYSGKSKSIVKKNVKKTALVFSDGLTREEYSVLKSAYNDSETWDIIAVTIEDIKGIATSNSGLNRHPPITFETFIAASQKYAGDYPEVFGNCYLYFQFEAIWAEMNTASLLSNPYSAFLDILKPAVVIFGHEAFTIECAFVEIAKSKQIPTLTLFHGGLGPKFCFMGLVGKSDHIVVWNNYDKELLEFYGVDPLRINVIGSIRYEQKYRCANLNKSRIDSKKTKFRIKSLGLDPEIPIVVLLTAAINSGFAAPVSNPRQHRDALRDITTLIKKRTDLQFIIKPHPSFDYYELYRNLINEELPNLFFFEELTFEEVIEMGRVSVLINYFTTAALESLINKTAVIFFQNAIYPIADWKSSINDLDIIEVSSISALESSIDELNKSLIDNNDAFHNSPLVAKIIGISESKVINRLINFINQLVIDKSDEEIVSQLKKNPGLFLKNQREKFFNRYTIWEILFVVSYLSGALKIGIGSIFKLKASTFTNKFSFSSNDGMLVLMPYVYASRSNSISKDWKSAAFLFSFMLRHLSIYLKLSTSERAKVNEFIVFNSLSNGYLIMILKRVYLHILKK